VRSFEQASGAAPAFAGKKFTKSAFYGVENSYRDFPKEGMYIAEKRYQELGGRITIIIKEGEGHYPLAPKDHSRLWISSSRGSPPAAVNWVTSSPYCC